MLQITQLTHNRRQEIIPRVFKGLSHMRSVGIIYRGLKPESKLLKKVGSFICQLAALNYAMKVNCDNSISNAMTVCRRPIGKKLGREEQHNFIKQYLP